MTDGGRRSTRAAPSGPPAAYVLGGYEAGLAVVRSLGRAGIRVLAVVSSENEHAGDSRHARRIVAPDPADDASAYVALLEGPEVRIARRLARARRRRASIGRAGARAPG